MASSFNGGFKGTFVYGDEVVSGKSTTAGNASRFVIGTQGGIQLGGALPAETVYPTSATATAGTAGTLPLRPFGYLTIWLGSVQVFVPYFLP